MKSERLIRISWDGPYNLEETKKLKSEKDYGIYQIYGRHVVFGRASLLYIGKAVKQSFGERLGEQSWLYDLSGLEVYIGRIYEEDYKDDSDWEDIVSQCETLLIYWHSPPYNSQNINSHKGRNIRIHNHKEIASLLYEVSTDWEKKMPKE